MNPIRSARQTAGLTQEELASKLKIARPMIAQWETGTRNPEPASIKRIARATKTDPDELMARCGRFPEWALKALRSRPLEVLAALRRTGTPPTFAPSSTGEEECKQVANILSKAEKAAQGDLVPVIRRLRGLLTVGNPWSRESCRITLEELYLSFRSDCELHKLLARCFKVLDGQGDPEKKRRRRRKA